MRNCLLTMRRTVIILFCLSLFTIAFAENRTILECPIEVPVVDGDSVAVPIYFSNDIALGAFTQGFTWDSDSLYVSSVDFSNSFHIGSNGYANATLRNDLKKVLIGWVDFSSLVPIPPQDSGLMCVIYFQVPIGTPDQCVNIDSSFVPPAGTFVFSPTTGGSITPNYYDCSVGDIIIGDVDDCYPPMVDDIPDQMVPEGGAFTTINLDDYVDDYSHPDDQLDWTYAGNIELDVSISAGRVATITIPHSNWNGSETITFTATDPGGLYGSDDATFTVTGVPDPPVAPDTSVSTPEDTDLVSSLPGYDYDDEPLTWAITAGPDFGVITSFNANTGEYTYDPNENYNGPDAMTYTVDDGSFPPATGVVSITVVSVNDPPEVTDIPGQTITEGGAFVTINLDDFVSDADHSDLEMSWNYSGNTNLDVDISVSRVATIIIPHSDWFGSETITFTATDPESGSDSDPATFVVNGTPDPPVAPDTSVSTPEDIDLVSNLPGYDVDLEPLTWTVLGGPFDGSLTSFNPNTGAYTYDPDENYFGPDSITYELDDGSLPPDTGIVRITVDSVNDPPEVGDIPDQMITEGGAFATFDLDDYVTDVESNIEDMDWTWSGNTGLLVSIDAGNVVTVATPNADWYGEETITFEATDPGGASGSDPATFTVTNINDDPVVGDIPDQTINESETFATISLDDYVTDIDDPDQQIDWTYSGNVELTVTIDGNRVATIGIPSPEWYGIETITFIATDTAGAFDSDAAIFEVVGENDPPVVSDIPDHDLNASGEFDSINLDDYVNDVDNHDSTIVWTFSGNEDLIVTIDENRVATVELPSPDWFGTVDITFTATDQGGLFDSDVATFSGAECGDVTGDGIVDISDVVFLLDYIFGGGPAPAIYASGDVDCNGYIEVSDAVYLLWYIFVPGSPEPCADC